jgi:hypothetical protein
MMSQQVEMMDGFVLTQDPVVSDGRPMTMRRAIFLWAALSLGGWGLIAACVGIAAI